MAGNFKGKNILVTGAGRGLGKRLAIGFAKLGARIGLVGRSKAELDAAFLEIEHNGGNSLRLRADVCDLEQMMTVTDRMRVHFGGPIHAAICAAGSLGPIGPFLEASPKLWIEALHVNLEGVANTCRAVVPAMAERREGKIVVLVCAGAEGPRPNFSAEAASKSGAVRLVETLAQEWLETNVQINCFHPGGAYTSSTDEILRAGERAGWKEVEAADQVRMSGGAPPEKQMELMQFLLSEQSNHVTGRFLHVNDDWKKMVHSDAKNSALYSMRRVTRG